LALQLHPSTSSKLSAGIHRRRLLGAGARWRGSVAVAGVAACDESPPGGGLLWDRGRPQPSEIMLLRQRRSSDQAKLGSHRFKSSRRRSSIDLLVGVVCGDSD
jgi:hypothetical protein